MTEEKQIIILGEVVEKVEDKKEILKIALKCVNCEYRDLLFKFLIARVSVNAITSGGFVSTSWSGIKPKPSIDKYVEIDGVAYNRNLICSKCKSSLIVLDKEFTKNNILRLL